MSLAMRNRIEVSGREINVEGHAKDSPTRDLAKGQLGVKAFVGEFLEAEQRIIRDDTLSEKGSKGGILKAAEATIERLRKLNGMHSARAKSQLKRLEKDLKIVDDADETPNDVRVYLWQRLDAMDKSARHGFAAQAFADGNTPVIRAVLDYVALFPLVFSSETVADWKSQFATARNPKLAREFATLKENIEKFEREVEEAIQHVSKHVGIGDTTLADRMNTANEREADAA